MSKTAHTRTPWEHTDGDIWFDSREYVCCGRGTYECCGEPDVAGGQELIAQASPEVAAFIVRAVNAHDALVEALKDMTARFDAAAISAGSSPGYVRMATEQARQALALAEASDNTEVAS